MIERYIVTSGPNIGRVHDEGIAWDLAHTEYTWRKENSNQPPSAESINDELKRLIANRIMEQAVAEFELVKIPKHNSLKDEIARTANELDLKQRRNLELKMESEAAVSQLGVEFAELMIENEVPGVEFIQDETSLGTAWVVRNYSPEIRSNGSENSSDFPEVTGIAILENGDIYEFFGGRAVDGKLSPQKSSINVGVFEGFYRNGYESGKTYKALDKPRITKYLSEVAKLQISGNDIPRFLRY